MCIYVSLLFGGRPLAPLGIGSFSLLLLLILLPFEVLLGGSNARTVDHNVVDLLFISGALRYLR